MIPRTDRLAERLAANAEAIAALLAGLPVDQAGWRPDPDSWSLLEVVNHLVDEEAEDFRRRLELVLRDPELEWPGIDPEGWVRERDYAGRKLAPSVARFLEERARSVSWLRSLKSPAWENSRTHPVAGGLSAGDLALSWLSHDLLHVAQICRLKAAWLAEHAAPFSTRYAQP